MFRLGAREPSADAGQDEGSRPRYLTIWDKAIDILILGFIWAVVCLPVVTIGPASIALYYTIVKTVRRERGTLWKTYWYAFKTNAKRGIVVTLLYIAYAFLLAMYILYGMDGVLFGGNGTVTTVLGFVLIIPFALSLMYIFPIISRFDTSLGKQLIYAFQMSVQHLPSTLAMLGLFLAAAFFVWQMPLLFLFVSGFYTFVCSLMIERIFKTYMKKQIEEAEQSGHIPWYLE